MLHNFDFAVKSPKENMLRRILVSVLVLGVLNCGTASAASTPSQLMRVPNPTIPAGYVPTWTFKVEMESTNKSDVDLGTKIFAAHHMMTSISVTTSNKASNPIFKLVGIREFAAPSEEADAVLEQINKASFASARNLGWTISEQALPRPR